VFGLQEQIEHYRKVSERIAAAADRSAPPAARMRVPTLEELDAMRAQQLSDAEADRVRRETIPAHLKSQDFDAKRIVREVSQRHGVPEDDIMGPRRFAYIVPARREAMYRVFNELDWTMERVGRFFNRDHTTVLHNIVVMQHGPEAARRRAGHSLKLRKTP
jgi:chromosomal replication initiation ATPase DnaA